jgi:UDP-sugar pyrophosphorylase
MKRHTNIAWPLGTSLTVYVRAGDVNGKSGFSPFPGNINQLVLKLATYVDRLAETGGVIAEFVNPKYTDASRSAFKKPSRLECMMQDYPKSLPPDAHVGFTAMKEVRLCGLQQ